MRKQKAITLISLVITIIILVILSSIGIYLSIGNNGLVPKAQEAEEKTTKEVATEKMNLKITNRQIEIYTKEERMPTLQEFADGLCEDDEIEYVELKSKKRGSLNKISVGENESIYTKLKEYPYEFEIDSSLRLASINGIKVASANQDDENSHWKLWKQKTGCISKEKAIDLPENFNELLIDIEVMDHTFDEEYYQVERSTQNSYCFTVTKEMLRDYYKEYILGSGREGYNDVCSIYINKTKVFCPEIMCYTTENMAEQFQLSVYYK